jgi:hypothetical protein
MYNPFCEHLLLRASRADGEAGPVFGTYHVLTPTAARRVGGPHTETDFDLTQLRAGMVELGRSCVHPAWRSGGVVVALWAALAEFMHPNALNTMVGCASVGMRDGGHFAASLWQQLWRTHLAPVEWRVRARMPLPLDELQHDLQVDAPPLIEAYLRRGTNELCAPVWDPDFNTADMPLLLRIADLPARYRRHSISACTLPRERLLPLAELVVDQRNNPIHRRLLVAALGFDLDFAAHARGQHHHAHDAFGVNSPAVAAHEDLALKAAGQLGELGRSPRMQAQLIADADVGLDHGRRVSGSDSGAG